MMLVRERVAQLIRLSGMRQDHLAERMGKNPRWLSNRLHGVVAIKADEIPLIAQALGVLPADLYTQEGVDALLDDLNLLLARLDQLSPRQRAFVHEMARRLADRTEVPAAAGNGNGNHDHAPT